MARRTGQAELPSDSERYEHQGHPSTIPRCGQLWKAIKLTVIIETIRVERYEYLANHLRRRPWPVLGRHVLCVLLAPRCHGSNLKTPESSTKTPSPSASSTQDTTLSTSTLPALSTTSAASPPAKIPQQYLSVRYNSAGVAIGIAAFLALVILGGRRLYRLLQEHPRGKQRAESFMLRWTGRGSANNVRDGREQQPLSPGDTLDGHTIVHLGPQRPGVHKLGGVELQHMSDKAVEVLG